MPEAVIVAAARTPIGRSKKGSLIDARPDDLAAFAIDASASRRKVVRSAAVPFLRLGRSRVSFVVVTFTIASGMSSPSWSRTATRTGRASPGPRMSPIGSSTETERNRSPGGNTYTRADVTGAGLKSGWLAPAWIRIMLRPCTSGAVSVAWSRRP